MILKVYGDTAYCYIIIKLYLELQCLRVEGDRRITSLSTCRETKRMRREIK